MGRTLIFTQVVSGEGENMDDCLKVLENRIERIEQLLKIDGVTLTVSEPQRIEWTNTMNSYYKDLAIKTTDENQKRRFLEKANKQSVQYRSHFWIKKNTRKTTWNDIYKMINSVKAVPYSFLQ